MNTERRDTFIENLHEGHYVDLQHDLDDLVIDLVSLPAKTTMTAKGMTVAAISRWTMAKDTKK